MRDPLPVLWIFPSSAFSHMKSVESGSPSLLFLCISRAEKSKKDQTPQFVFLTENNKLVSIFVLCSSVFSSEFSCRSVERYLYMCHLIPEGGVFSLVAESVILNI